SSTRSRRASLKKSTHWASERMPELLYSFCAFPRAISSLIVDAIAITPCHSGFALLLFEFGERFSSAGVFQRILRDPLFDDFRRDIFDSDSPVAFLPVKRHPKFDFHRVFAETILVPVPFG